MTVRSLCMAFGGNVADVSVRDLRLDSRCVEAGDVFFALSENLQQHVAEACARGAAAVVVDERQRSAVTDLTVPVVTVNNLRADLGAIAHRFYGSPSEKCKVVGVTGTNGKTSCSHWLAQAWRQLAGPAGFMGTLGCGLMGDEAVSQTGLTTADVLSNHRLLAALYEQGAQAVMMEVSSHALDQGRVDAIVFDTAVFTNLSRDHLDYHGDMDNYAAAKARLFEREELKIAVINRDDAFGKVLCERVERSGVQLLSYAIHDQTADLGVERCEVTGRGIAASIRTPWGKGALQSRFPGGYNLLNVLAVVGTLCAHGMSLHSVLGAMEQLQAVPGRTQMVSSDSDDILVVVDYAHTPDALEKILTALREQCKGKLYCVFGCGGDRDSGKRPQMATAAEALADAVVVTSDNPRHEAPQKIIGDIVAGFQWRDRHQVVVDRAEAINMAIVAAHAGDVVLLAGKGHEEYQEIAGVRQPFSDVLCAQQALQRRRDAAQLSGMPS